MSRFNGIRAGKLVEIGEGCHDEGHVFLSSRNGEKSRYNCNREMASGKI